MGLDLRLPLGMMFLTIGVIMAGYGAVTWHSPMYVRSLGQNINMLWGGAMMLFGATMLLLGMRARTRDRMQPGSQAPSHGDRPRAGH